MKNQSSENTFQSNSIISKCIFLKYCCHLITTGATSTTTAAKTTTITAKKCTPHFSTAVVLKYCCHFTTTTSSSSTIATKCTPPSFVLQNFFCYHTQSNLFEVLRGFSLNSLVDKFKYDLKWKNNFFSSLRLGNLIILAVFLFYFEAGK